MPRPGEPAFIGRTRGVKFAAAKCLLLAAMLSICPPSTTAPAAQSAQPSTSLPGNADLGRSLTVPGVVCFFHAPASELFVQNETLGFLVRLPQLPHFEPAVGQFVEVDGTVVSTNQHVELSARSIKLLGEAPLPSPLRPTYSELSNGSADARYCELSGIIRAVSHARTDSLLPIELAMPGGLVSVWLKDYHLSDCQKLVDAEVRILGVCLREEVVRGSENRVTLRVSGMGSIAVVLPAPSDPFSQHTVPISEITSGRFNSPHRVKVSGSVLLHRPGQLLFVEDHGTTLGAESAQSTLLRPGDSVEVLGFPDPSEKKGFLKLAIYRKVGHGPEPQPSPVTPEQLKAGVLHGRLVNLQAVIESTTESEIDTLHLTTGEVRLLARMPTAQVPTLAPGTRVEVTGVCLTNKNGDLEILLRSSLDLKKLGSGGLRLRTAACLFVVAALALMLIWRRSRHRSSQFRVF